MVFPATVFLSLNGIMIVSDSQIVALGIQSENALKQNAPLMIAEVIIFFLLCQMEKLGRTVRTLVVVTLL